MRSCRLNLRRSDPRGWCLTGGAVSAFDAYHEKTLKRLEDERNEFGNFLEQLRHAKDKAEFDQFMDERHSRPSEPPQEPFGNGQDQPGT
ncbi:MAG: hypothetical protein CMM23_00800 [Rhodospirillaceae bacterium]|nr:hypothetical protein [Rhodospirillaceae bacterium]